MTFDSQPPSSCCWQNQSGFKQRAAVATSAPGFHRRKSGPLFRAVCCSLVAFGWNGVMQPAVLPAVAPGPPPLVSGSLESIPGSIDCSPAVWRSWHCPGAHLPGGSSHLCAFLGRHAASLHGLWPLECPCCEHLGIQGVMRTCGDAATPLGSRSQPGWHQLALCCIILLSGGCPLIS